jgi:DNA invertase Pin-like site-specific DNA recombinase
MTTKKPKEELEDIVSRLEKEGEPYWLSIEARQKRQDLMRTLQEAGWSNRQIAKALDIDQHTVAKWANEDLDEL